MLLLDSKAHVGSGMDMCCGAVGGIMEGTMEGMLMTHEHPKYCGQ